jgi:hypothetical protein
MAVHRKVLQRKIQATGYIDIFEEDRNDPEFMYTITRILTGTDGGNVTFKIDNGPEITWPSGNELRFLAQRIDVISGELVVIGDKNQKTLEFSG